MEKTSWKDEPSPKPTVEVLKPDPKAQTAAEPKRVHGLLPTLTLRLSGLTPETPLKGKWGKMMDGGGGSNQNVRYRCGLQPREEHRTIQRTLSKNLNPFTNQWRATIPIISDEEISAKKERIPGLVLREDPSFGSTKLTAWASYFRRNVADVLLSRNVAVCRGWSLYGAPNRPTTRTGFLLPVWSVRNLNPQEPIWVTKTQIIYRHKTQPDKLGIHPNWIVKTKCWLERKKKNSPLI